MIGGGIAGLAGAHALATAGHHVILIEAGDRLGGKILTSSFAGRPVDEGPDAFLTRRPHALELCRKLGLADDLVAPATGAASVWVGGRLRPLPAGLVLGVPTEFGPLRRSRILSPAGWCRAAIEPWLPGHRVDADVAVGAMVRRRYGRQLHERLVDPLIGGINASRTEDLSLDIAAPALASAARRSASLTAGLRAAPAPPAPAPPSPLFLAPRTGMGAVVDALVAALADLGVISRLSTPVIGIERPNAGGYRVAVPGEALEADRVLVAVPAPAAGRLLAPVSAVAGELLAAISYSSVALVTLAYPAGAARQPVAGSGFLVPRREGRLITACSVYSNKWPIPERDEGLILRASVGRAGTEEGLDHDDATLVERVSAELGRALGLSAGPSNARVSRWHQSFPQFSPGHLTRMAKLQSALAADAPGVAVAGAYLAGVGIPSCIRTAAEAAELLTKPEN